MLTYLNEWHDWWRVTILALCVTCTVMLVCKQVKYRKQWNYKTHDYWRSGVCWSLTGVFMVVEGIYSDGSFGIRLIFATLAACFSIRGLRQNGAWGGCDA